MSYGGNIEDVRSCDSSVLPSETLSQIIGCSGPFRLSCHVWMGFFGRDTWQMRPDLADGVNERVFSVSSAAEAPSRAPQT